MEMKAYLLTEGCYSDYNILGLVRVPFGVDPKAVKAGCEQEYADLKKTIFEREPRRAYGDRDYQERYHTRYQEFKAILAAAGRLEDTDDEFIAQLKRQGCEVVEYEEINFDD